VLDDLAQPPSYSSPSHLAVLDELIERISKKEIPADLRTVLTQFPESFQKIIELSRTPSAEKKKADIQRIVGLLIREIQNSSLVNII
jgi:hypothetical protein